jgi:uracil permease
MEKNLQAIGYLPDEKPTFWKLILYALQQVVVMFPATVTVALITGFHVSTTIFASGLATFCFILVTGRKIPLYYGSSFSYLSAISGLLASQAFYDKLSPAAQAALDSNAAILPNEVLSYVQFGIVMSGLVSIAAGFLVKLCGTKSVEKILPASITGPIAMIIGLTLAGNALSDAAPQAAADVPVLTSGWVWLVSLATLLSTVVFSKYLKGFLGQLPLLLGACVGCVFAGLLYAFGGADMNMFRTLAEETTSIFAVPTFTFPKVSWIAVAAIMPIAIATIPESTAHIYQLDIYVNDLAKKKKSTKKYDIAGLLGRNLVGDGLGDMITGFIGGPAGTNYGENISTMAITKVFSVPVLLVAAVIAMAISFFTPLVNAIYAIPTAVIGGLEVYLFGAIAAQGAAIMIEKKVDMFDSKNIAVIASIMIIGLGGQYAFSGNIPFFGVDVPCIAGAAVFGILLNLLLSIGDKKEKEIVKTEE